ncbi:aldehyde dehydrogenase family protein [Hansschlegelia quercus]|uniref:Aldehyde dehydrogenase family protein n=1 Tax=Hansschlegelia quercus TaxID=2528245 RepID=A0A4Q9GB97_9HYPH|nr:aldehyde dehydrogenase family protein [Hansschlegelia quercus]TBN48297.1 aldehyde dehydrogenase family protein [Hansschlegelia quercus]
MTDQICISPIDGQEFARRSSWPMEQLEQAIADARAAQAEWTRVPLSVRSAKMLEFMNALLGLNQQIVPELALQMGRPVRYGGEMRPVEERVRHCIATAEASLSPVTPQPKPGFRRMIKRDPLGLVLVIAPWNYPYLTAVNTIVPALLAGNAVILKHAAQTILAGERFQEAMDKVDLPKGLFRNVVMDHDQAGQLISAGRFDHINFTGSVAGGRTVERAAGGTFTSMGLELGGKDPAYVRADADLDFAVENLVDGAFYNSGQCCCGIERVYVHESHYDRFVAGAVEAASKYVLGNPLDETTTLGPMAHVRFAATVRAHIADALERGATAHLDPASFPADKAGTAYLGPQVLTGVDHSMRVMVEESFGPVVGIMKVRDDEEAIRLMNDSAYGLTASIWTADIEAAEAIGDLVETGTVFMNRCDYLDPALAWTGVKDTGRGASLSEIGFHQLTRPKSFHLRERS